MSVNYPEPYLSDVDVLRAHATIIGSVGSGKQVVLFPLPSLAEELTAKSVGQLALRSLVRAAMAQRPDESAACYLVIDEFRPVRPPLGSADPEPPR